MGHTSAVCHTFKHYTVTEKLSFVWMGCTDWFCDIIFQRKDVAAIQDSTRSGFQWMPSVCCSCCCRQVIFCAPGCYLSNKQLCLHIKCAFGCNIEQHIGSIYYHVTCLFIMKAGVKLEKWTHNCSTQLNVSIIRSSLARSEQHESHSKGIITEGSMISSHSLCL